MRRIPTIATGIASSEFRDGRSRKSAQASRPDEHDLRVAEDGREPGADVLDRVVPEDQVGGEEGARRSRPRAAATTAAAPSRRSSQIGERARETAAPRGSGRTRPWSARRATCGRGSPRRRSRPRPTSTPSAGRSVSARRTSQPIYTRPYGRDGRRQLSLWRRPLRGDASRSRARSTATARAAASTPAPSASRSGTSRESSSGCSRARS